MWGGQCPPLWIYNYFVNAMSYSEFTLDKVRKAFDLTIIDKVNIFASIPEIKCPGEVILNEPE